MKVIRVDSLIGSDRDVRFDSGMVSLRPILEREGMGFSVHKTIIPKGGPWHWHYKNHKEACYCISGLGRLINLETGQDFTIAPGVLYALDNNDDHAFQAFEETVLISVFNPPVKGNEVHREDGSYE